ncbi:hypothetical protein D9611_013737 [Ephemerocybe angulata]|uniref:DUF6534 domain-containing protein n=1 Tax=Ephemerocybe angulata TaxID=980116 RepID=A0A8H5F1Z3_9AGAR|nr:hypothetical protein D9611_013737 [Tulosesus angulatus]
MPTHDFSAEAQSFKNRNGAQMLAALLTNALFGVAILMAIQYFCNHARNDPRVVKAFVGVLGVLSVLETIFTNHQLYEVFVTDYKSGYTPDFMPFSVSAKTACIILTAFFSQLFYATRIWQVGKRFESVLRFMAYPITALAFLQLGGGLIQVVIMIQGKTYSEIAKRVQYLLKSMFIHGGASAACDLLITISLVAILKSNSSDGTRRTKSLVSTLVKYAITRGIVTSVLALLTVIIYDLAGGTYYFLIPFSCGTHIYVISVISMLISREGLREELDNSFHLSHLPTTTHGFANTSAESDSAVDKDSVSEGGVALSNGPGEEKAFGGSINV